MKHRKQWWGGVVMEAGESAIQQVTVEDNMSMHTKSKVVQPSYRVNNNMEE